MHSCKSSQHVQVCLNHTSVMAITCVQARTRALQLHVEHGQLLIAGTFCKQQQPWLWTGVRPHTKQCTFQYIPDL
jgi:hypothetical protein